MYGVTTRVGLYVAIFIFLKKKYKGFSLLSLTQILLKTNIFTRKKVYLKNYKKRINLLKYKRIRCN
ncbi:hypothetical protein FNW17_03010 [Flavobacterium franklandianum]|uniref:Uncharacterized protein n=1 Tax=Flavobacterium franklandianum TaxID=2594430 RepID=A0A553CQD0_9FLAO|nr:hypothetical protein FNW17_03010 [Flavobacterium franklandianum]